MLMGAPVEPTKAIRDKRREKECSGSSVRKRNTAGHWVNWEGTGLRFRQIGLTGAPAPVTKIQEGKICVMVSAARREREATGLRSRSLIAGGIENHET